MITAPSSAWILAVGLALTAGVAAADPAPVPDRAEGGVSAAEGRSWDAVGRAVPGQAVAHPAGGELAVSALERHQAKKRAMVRRMLMLMVAYR
jgi:hypothetical protein